MPGLGKNTWLLTVENNGNVLFSRYGTSGYADASSDTWLSFQLTFLIN